MESITKNIVEREVDSMRFFASHTSAKDVVSIEGSVLGGSYTLPRSKEFAAYISGDLLDAGTTEHDKDSLRERLGARGISLSFSTGGDRTYFSASCLPEDVSLVFSTITECLRSSLFRPTEVKLVLERTKSELMEEKSETRAQASQEIKRLLYDKSHALYAETTAARLKNLSEITPKEVRDFGKKLGRKGLILSMVGDIDPKKAINQAEKSFGTLREGTFEKMPVKMNSKIVTANESLVSIQHKTSIDTILAVSVPLTETDSRYLPLSMLTLMLGGSGFTSHLMKTIRERDGLTYDVRAQLVGFGDGLDGFFRVYASFSPDQFKHSVAQLRKEIGLFFKNGITEKELAAQKLEAAARYLIGLSTTRGLARTLHTIGAQGRPLFYLDEYPLLVQNITLEQVQKVAPLIPLDKLSLAAAGTFVK